jgi:hypothetical protein
LYVKIKTKFLDNIIAGSVPKFSMRTVLENEMSFLRFLACFFVRFEVY